VAISFICRHCVAARGRLDHGQWKRRFHDARWAGRQPNRDS
jgi:hypothetical protein